MKSVPSTRLFGDKVPKPVSSLGLNSQLAHSFHPEAILRSAIHQVADVTSQNRLEFPVKNASFDKSGGRLYCGEAVEAAFNNN
jgi:hypothetical protein